MRELRYPSYDAYSPPRVSWGAIFAGAFLSLATFAGLAMLGAGIGLVSAPAADSAQGLATGLGIGGGIWLLLSGICAYAFGGWVAGRLTPIGRVSDSVIHGLVSWSAATMAFLFLTTVAVGGAAGGAVGLMGASMGALGSAAGEGRAERFAQAPVETTRETVRDVRQTAERIAAETGVSAEEAQAQAREGAQTAAQTAGALSFFGFLTMLCNAIAAALGGRAGARLWTPAPVETVRTREPALR